MKLSVSRRYRCRPVVATVIVVLVCGMMQAWPLFGIAHRITSDPIQTTARNGKPVTIPEGTVLCFNYPAFHRYEVMRW